MVLKRKSKRYVANNQVSLIGEIYNLSSKYTPFKMVLPKSIVYGVDLDIYANDIDLLAAEKSLCDMASDGKYHSYKAMRGFLRASRLKDGKLSSVKLIKPIGEYKR